MKKPDVSFVIPEYNERESLPALVAAVDAAMAGRQYEYVFIDDGSTDGSFEVLKSLKKSSRVPWKIIRFRINQGKSPALAVGFEHTSGKYVVTLDADLQDDPSEVPNLLEKLEEGADVVVGWRKNRQDPKGKIRSSHIFNSVVSQLSGLHLHDMNCGMKAFRGNVTKEVELYGELHRFIPVLAARRGFRVVELPVVHHSRRYGSSKFGTSRVGHAFFDLVTTLFLTSFRNNPLKVFGTAGMVFICSGLAMLGYLSVLHFLGETISRRPLLFFGILLVLFGIQIFSTGLIGELIASVVSKNDRYPIAEIVE